MTDSFLPRPSPDPHHVFECDAHGHLRGQRLVINYEDPEGHGEDGDEYIFGQGARKEGEDAEALVSNHHPSYQRAANASPKSPSPVSCFIILTDAFASNRTYPPFMLFIVSKTHSLLVLLMEPYLEDHFDFVL